MSLQLDRIEERLIEFRRSRPVQFCYSRDCIALKELCDNAMKKLSQGKYGRSTIERGRSLISQWKEIEAANPFAPVDKCDLPQLRYIAKILYWTLERCQFTLVASRITNELVHGTFRVPSSRTLVELRVMNIAGDHYIAYLGSFAFQPKTITHHVPLRFELCCILPLLSGGPQPLFDSMPTEVTSNVISYLSLDEMVNTAIVSRQSLTSFNAQSLWHHVWSNLGKYLNGNKAIGLQVDPGEHKQAVAAAVMERQRKREARFVHSASDWSGPIHYIDSRPGMIDPIRSLRRRRIDVMDDLDLFM